MHTTVTNIDLHAELNTIEETALDALGRINYERLLAPKAREIMDSINFAVLKLTRNQTEKIVLPHGKVAEIRGKIAQFRKVVMGLLSKKK